MSPSRARFGVSLLFFSNGVLFSALLPRYPEIKDSFALSDGQFGLMVIALPVGSLAAATLGGTMVRLLGARVAAAGSTVLMAAAFAAASAAPSPVFFVAFMVIGGLLDAVADSAQNVQAMVVERWKQRSIINSMHALWSMGAAAGGVIGAVAAARDVSLPTQMIVNGVVWSAVAVLGSTLAAAPAAPGADDSRTAVKDSSPRRQTWRLLIPLAALAICGTLIEEVASSWVVLYLGRETSASVGLAGFGFTAVLASQFIGRILGDPMTTRWGRVVVARIGGVLIITGVAAAVVSRSPALAFAGFALMGVGCATLVPAAYAAADQIPGLREGSGIARLGWLMRSGTLIASPAIGAVAEVGGLRAGMAVPLAAGVVAVAATYRQAPPREPRFQR